jgi:MFS transporter, AAHS family, 4-hydroxybenzoate transporter
MLPRLATGETRGMPNTSPPARALDVGRFIDDRAYGRYQLLVAVMCGLIVFMDGFDAQSMGFVAPALVTDLGIARSAMGPLFSSGLLGMMLGALGFGWLADRVGRKPVLVACTLIFGVGSLVCAVADTYNELLVYRLLTGLGLGGAMPNTIALTAEYTPKRFRATAVMIMFCGVSIGAAAGGFASAALIETFGWRSIFVLGGVLPIVTAAAAAFLLPESIRFLVLRGGRDARVARYIAKIAPGTDLRGAAFVVAEPPAKASAVQELFAERRAPITALLWVIFFMSLLELYFLNNWLPTIMTGSGIALETAAIITALFQLGGTVGALTLGRRIDRNVSFNVLALAYGAACVAVLAISAAGSSLALLTLTIFAAGFCVIGGQTGSNALAAEFYPTAIRSTGVGWALGIGRIGSILGPFVGGWLLATVTDLRHVFWAAAVPPLLATVAALAAARIAARRAKSAAGFGAASAVVRE